MNEHDTLPPGGMGPLDPTDIRFPDEEPSKEGLRCPDWPGDDDDDALTGCGGTNILWDGEVWICLDCGLDFTTEAGTPLVRHAISIDHVTEPVHGPDTWSCECGVDGSDMYDLASHANDVFDVLPA